MRRKPKIGGCKRGKPDPRDFVMLCSMGRPLPDSVDLRSLCSAVENQRQVNSCTANACVGAMEILERKQGIPQKDLSRLFVYYNTRELEGDTTKDAGAYMSSAMKAIRKTGACLESIWSYNPAKVFDKPTPECYIDGEKRQTVEYARVRQGYGIMSALAEGFPVAFGMMLDESFADVAGKTGVVPIPGEDAVWVGGHAMLIVGYDRNKRMFIVRNSWGHRWGKDGYCEIPFTMINDRQMSWDFWVVRSIEEPEDSYTIRRPEII